MDSVVEVRDKFTDTVKRLLVGPNPLKGFCCNENQEISNDGEEILFNGSPLSVYITGVLFPQNQNRMKGISELLDGDLKPTDEDSDESNDESNADIDDYKDPFCKSDADDAIDGETSKINARYQSAMGITLCVPYQSGLNIEISAGTYMAKSSVYPNNAEMENGQHKIKMSDKTKTCYFRKQHDYKLYVQSQDMPAKNAIHNVYQVKDNDGNDVALRISVTYRMDLENGKDRIYTVTLINTNTDGYTNNCSAYEKCWFQVGFAVSCTEGFLPLPKNFDKGLKDEDYRLNALLYRDVHDYAIGHGCAATWENELPKTIKAECMPEYEVKPIVPNTLPGIQLDMKVYSENRCGTIEDLTNLANKYEKWIDIESEKVETIPEEHRATAEGQIALCRKCLARIRRGISLLGKDDSVWEAFAFTNKAMLMQQLHYRLPFVKYSDYDKRNCHGILENEIILPDTENSETWYKNGEIIYGKWRPFQIAFLVMNIVSINDKDSEERKIMDLIWFPTGGGKTEAYLGLTAFTIFLRKLRNKEDRGTSVIMRYTLRLLTSQQYERAASLICAMEKIRAENEDVLGKERITIGLWVGNSLTPNMQKDAAKKIREIQEKKDRGNASIILKCPWCGASMSTYRDKAENIHTPGYEVEKDKVHLICGNKTCDFHDYDFELPLRLFDDDIYENPPTLLFGTVDKFAMLPFIPKAKSLFGGDRENAAPDLIIQDELHLITGPLGSAVGIYEVLIDELCKSNGGLPKRIASTATISHAKQQCNALYGCGEENVFQFPVQGTSYKDSFFAREKSDGIGRKYIGLYGAAMSTSASASIATFAALIYAAKAIEVNEEKARDPYWTNLAYFGSMRELGQAATWYMTDIKERLETIYKWRMEASLDRTKRRYIYGTGLAELTSRMSNEEIPKILKKLEESYSGNVEMPEDDKADKKKEFPLDICLATNMISVGVDVSRLGLMTVTGQPKTMSEYIQTTSRVGRDAAHAPGVVYVIYNTSKSRDKSHYEKFQSQHEKLYYSVEPTSVTPFSEPMRERALPTIFAAIHRLIHAPVDKRENADYIPSNEELEKIVDSFVNRIGGIDCDEAENAKRQLEFCYRQWIEWNPLRYSRKPGKLQGEAPLLIQTGTIRPDAWKDRGWDAPTSMRNVDGTCGLDTTKTIWWQKERRQ